MYLRYPNIRKQTLLNSNRDEIVYDTKKGRTTVPNRIYGGKVVENVCQALARIVIGEQMLMVARRLPVVMTVHDAETEALDAGLRPIRMNQTHEWVLDELCNGEERRRKAEEEAEASRQAYAKQAAMSAQLSQAQLYNQYANAALPTGLLGSGSASTMTSTYANQLNQAMSDTKKSMIESMLGKVFK